MNWNGVVQFRLSNYIMPTFANHYSMFTEWVHHLGWLQRLYLQTSWSQFFFFKYWPNSAIHEFPSPQRHSVPRLTQSGSVVTFNIENWKSWQRICIRLGLLGWDFYSYLERSLGYNLWRETTWHVVPQSAKGCTWILTTQQGFDIWVIFSSILYYTYWGLAY